MHRSLVREWLVVAVVLCIGAFAGGMWQVSARVDSMLFDLAMTTWRRDARKDVVLVAVDEKSLAALGRWPWPRSVHATLLNKLDEARAGPIGFDIILAERDAANTGADLQLANSIKRLGRVTLPLHHEVSGKDVRVVPPEQLFADAAAQIGHIDLEIDPDGLVRRVFLYEGSARAATPHFALQLLRLARPDASTDQAFASLGERDVDRKPQDEYRARDQRYVIPYAGPPGHFERISYVDLLRGTVPVERLANRIVLIGATAVGLGDSYPTPVSGEGATMPGIEITANILQGLAERIDVRVSAPFVQGGIAAGLTLLIVAILPFLSPRNSLIVAVGAVPGILVASLLLVRAGGIWFPPTIAVIAALLAHPFWSWRRLEAAMRFLAAELRAVETEPATLSVQATGTSTIASSFALDDFFAIRLNAAHDAAERLRTSRRVFRQSLAGLPVAVVVCDRNEHPILANQRAQEFLGLSRSSAPEPLSEVLRRQQRGALHDWREILARTIHDKATHTYETTLSGARSCLVTVAPYALVEDVVVGVIVSLADVSELKRLEQEREQFLQFISHDLRAPLNSVLALLELTPGGHPTSAIATRDARIASYAHRGLALVEGMLHQARADRLDPVALQPLYIAEIVHEACDEVWPIAARKQQVIHRDISISPSLVRGDPDLLLRAVQNLLANAVKYSNIGSNIWVSLARIGEQWSCRVRDEGPGIRPEDIGRLFYPFRRLDRPDGADPGGIGLGLAFVKTVAEKHGGSIAVSSTLGNGATFELRLAVAAEDEAPAPLDHATR